MFLAMRRDDDGAASRARARARSTEHPSKKGGEEQTLLALRWIVVETKPGAEKTVREGLVERNREALLPLRWTVVRLNRKEQRVTRPLFPGYVFAGLSRTQPWTPVASMPGVRRVLTWPDGAPMLVPARAIADLQERMATAGEAIWLGQQIDDDTIFEPDEPVQVIGGPFEGYRAFYRGTERDRIRVLLDILGRETEIALPKVQVIPDR